MARCIKCGDEIPEGATTCANCGAPAEGPARPLGLKAVMAILAIGALLSISQIFSMNPNYSFMFGMQINPTHFKIGALLQGMVSIYCLYGLMKWKKSGFYVLMALYAFTSANILASMVRIPDILRMISGQVEGFAASMTIGAFLVTLGINVTIMIYAYGLKERFVN